MIAVNHTQPSFQTNTQNVAANTPVKEAPKVQMGARLCRNVEMFGHGILGCCIGGTTSAVTGLLVSAAYSSFTAQDERDYKLNFCVGASYSIGAVFIGIGARLLYLSVRYINSERVLISNAPDTEPSESTIKDKND